ncbi:MAG: VOC family protein [Verrucomicrobiaceae bacterium]
MSAISLSLIVLRAANPATLAAFYAHLGLNFVKHRHGNGPEHFSAELDHGVVFEVYPLQERQSGTETTRIGFAVESVDLAFATLIQAGARAVSPPASSEWGRRAVIDDPSGHRCELTEFK